jgi:hypothetical protein
MGLVKNKKVDKLRVSTKKQESVVKPTPSIKFSKGEVEFLLYMIQEGNIPGKRLIEAVQVVEKLQQNYKKQK